MPFLFSPYVQLPVDKMMIDDKQTGLYEKENLYQNLNDEAFTHLSESTGAISPFTGQAMLVSDRNIF